MESVLQILPDKVTACKVHLKRVQQCTYKGVTASDSIWPSFLFLLFMNVTNETYAAKSAKILLFKAH